MPRLTLLAFVLALCACCVPASCFAAPNRIVSLIPSITEDLFAIGAGPQVVAVSQFTDYPASAARLPAVASFLSVDAERIVRLHPDLVVGITAQGSLVADLRRAGVHVELLHNDSFDDLFSTLARLGNLSGHPREAAALAASLRAQTARLVRSVPRGTRPKTFVVLGTAPLFTVGDGSYIAHLIGLAGGVNASGLRDAYARYSAEALLARQPDVIVADTYSGVRAVLNEPPWNALRAIRNGRLYVLQDAAILERPGPRYNLGLAWLIGRLHPNAARP
jgi:ABC-type Fe3+-hydroxamate transport system substrate-binding protein